MLRPSPDCEASRDWRIGFLRICLCGAATVQVADKVVVTARTKELVKAEVMRLDDFAGSGERQGRRTART
jgi:hypothetical protein